MNKYSLHIGINYEGADLLRGCINDALNLAQYYKTKGYKTYVLTSPENTTREYLLRSIFEFVNFVYSNDGADLAITYSGHGAQVIDHSEDEIDKYDECICPIDFRAAGVITDDQLRAMLTFLPSSVNMFILLDCCHSGSGFDLAYVVDTTVNILTTPTVTPTVNTLTTPTVTPTINTLTTPTVTPTINTLTTPTVTHTINTLQYTKRKINNNITAANVIMLSGCQDAQKSSDTLIDNVYRGALTWSFLTALTKLDNKSDTTRDIDCEKYIKLLAAIRELLAQKGYKQVPVLSLGR